MDVNECLWILRNLEYMDKNLWEATRMRIFSTASMFSKGQLKMADIMKFPWDKEVNEEEPTPTAMTDEERKNMESYILGVLNARDANK